jgi:hypothetical protein
MSEPNSGRFPTPRTAPTGETIDAILPSGHPRRRIWKGRLCMARFILIERATGGVYVDMARFGAAGDVVSPADAVCLVDRHAGRFTRSYVNADSDAAQYDTYKIQQASSDSVSASDEAVQKLGRERNYSVRSLVAYK